MAASYFLRCTSAPFPTFELSSGRFIVGRSSNCDFVVSHLSVSRRHAEFRTDGSGTFVTDLNSLNGTYVDNQRTRSARVLRSQVVRLGEVSFLLALDENDNADG